MSPEILLKYPHGIKWSSPVVIVLDRDGNRSFGFRFKICQSRNPDDWYTLVSEVSSAPAKNKLNAGDYIRSINGKSPETPQEAEQLLYSLENLDSLRIIVQRPQDILSKYKRCISQKEGSDPTKTVSFRGVSIQKSDLNVYIGDIPPSLYDQLCTDLQIQMPRENDWKLLGELILRLTTRDVERYKTKTNPADCLLWDLRNEKGFTVPRLINFLRKMEREDIISPLQKWLDSEQK
ncbi:uncharacterized protein LOC127729277 [Mytilus californianus]|uniref:uncharacterized protein LOC127729277 n=1 Tax=Mytilus californianus TaxID=6549 RepID=UPI0022461A6C|nr:uncharacterized protein LOC127729277 [Mytilus californianus]